MTNWIKEEKHGLKSEYYAFIKDIRKGRKLYSIENKTTLIEIEKFLKEYGYEDAIKS